MSASPPVTVRAATERDLEAVNRIYNEEVRGGIATWELDEWSIERRVEWLRDRSEDEPVLVAELEGEVIGFAYLTRYRGRRGYRYTRENTVFVSPAYHRRGVGRLLMAALIDSARSLRLHTLIAWIDEENAASIELHRTMGYQQVGREQETGHKFGRWRNGVELQLLLDA